MKFHSTLVEKLINVFEVNAGWPEQKKLREALAKMDLTVYEQGAGGQILVSTEELEIKLREQKVK
jgi:hypothetical protein